MGSLWHHDANCSDRVEVPSADFKFLIFELVIHNPNHTNHTPATRTRKYQRGCMVDAQVEGSSLHLMRPPPAEPLTRYCSYQPLGWGYEEGRGPLAAAATGRSLCRKCAQLVEPHVARAFELAAHQDT